MLRTCLGTLALVASLQALADPVHYPTNECINRLGQDQRLGSIADKVALARSDDTAPAMFELDRPATATERMALDLWSRLRQACFDLGIDYRREVAPREQAILAVRLFDLHQRLIGELRDGGMTYAAFNGRRVEVYLAARVFEAGILQRAEETAAPEAPALPAGSSEI